jgi:hypothetical protein
VGAGRVELGAVVGEPPPILKKGETMKLKLLVLALMSVCWGSALAQEKPGLPVKEKPELTAKEKLGILSAQVKGYELRAQKKQLDDQLDAAIAEADRDTAAKIDAVYTSRKATRSDLALCDAPYPGPCEHAPAGELTLQQVKK